VGSCGSVTELAVEWLPSQGLYPQLPRPLTLLPLIPAMFFWVALVRAIQKVDELQKRIWYESCLCLHGDSGTHVHPGGTERAGIHRAPGDEVGSSMMLFGVAPMSFAPGGTDDTQVSAVKKQQCNVMGLILSWVAYVAGWLT